MFAALAFGLLVAADPPLPRESVVPFRTDLAPRVDPVFGDAAAFRANVDKFLALHAEMEKVRDDFSNAVHQTLGDLAEQPAGSKKCPDALGPHYQKASTAGARYLALGRQLEAKFREVRRQDEMGDSAALTPDYRMKIKKARDLYWALLRDFREMKIAFYDQLGAELRHAGCQTAVTTAASKPGVPAADPNDPAAWSLEEPTPAPVVAEPATGKAGKPELPPAAIDDPARAADPKLGASDARLATSVWIQVDNSRCHVPSRLAIDGANVAEIAAGKKTQVRTRSGPHELCVLPATDTRACGAAGTLRKAYFHEGWSVSVRCDR